MYQAGLILEGGGMRGLYTAGVLDYFMDINLEFKEVYGVSAGACNACSYLSKQRGRSLRVNTEYLDDPRYCGLESLIRTGDLFGVDMLYDIIPNELDPYDYETFAEYPGKAYAVTTNCETGKAEYMELQDMHRDILAVRASSSLPMVSRMVEIQGYHYLDGGISDSIPVIQSMKNGNQKNVVVLTRDPSYRKEPSKTMAAFRMRYSKYPNLIRQMEHRHIRYNRTLDFLKKGEEAGKIFVIQPQKPVEIARIEKNKEKLKELYEIGYEEARNQHGDLLDFLG